MWVRRRGGVWVRWWTAVGVVCLGVAFERTDVKPTEGTTEPPYLCSLPWAMGVLRVPRSRSRPIPVAGKEGGGDGGRPSVWGWGWGGAVARRV